MTRGLTKNTTLVIPHKPDVERDAVAECWLQDGGAVHRLERFWEPPEFLCDADVRLYGPQAFCEVVAQCLDLQLVIPSDALLCELDTRWTARSVRRCTVEDIGALQFPVFAKSAVPKMIAARTYTTIDELQDACSGLPSDDQLLISDVVHFVAEARSFARGTTVLDVSWYENAGDTDRARDFASAVLEDCPHMDACVVDVGVLEDDTLVVVEFNAAWGAGLNGCDPKLVLPAIMSATQPRQHRRSIALLDVVELLVDLPEAALAAGEQGAVVEIFTTPDLAYEVEFVDSQGRTRALLTLSPTQVKLVWKLGDT